jgi:outer membrane protein assembly factor BamB
MTESACVEAPGCVLTASRSGIVRRIDASTGEELARFEPGLLDGFAGSPVVRGDRVFAAALDGKTFVLGLARLDKIAEIETGPVRATPLSTARGVLVVDENGEARLLDDAGGVVWRKKIGRLRLDPAAAGSRAVMITADAELLLVEIATGDVVRRTQLRNEVQWGPPTVRAGRAFFANDGGEIVCCDATTLEVDWKHTVDGPVRGRVSATDLRVVACTVNGSIHVLDAETGGVLSRTIVGGRVEDGICDLADGGYVAVSRKGGVIRFDAKGQIVWKYDAGEDIGSPPRLVADRVVFVTRKGAVVALTPEGVGAARISATKLRAASRSAPPFAR